MSQQVTSWSHLARSLALMLGFGGLLTTDAQAAKSELQAPPPKHAGSSDSVLLRMEADKIYISEREGVFQELALGDTPEADYLRSLLKGTRGDVVSVPTGSIIVANGGGAADGAKPKGPGKDQSGNTNQSDDKQSAKKAKQAPAATEPTSTKPTNGK